MKMKEFGPRGVHASQTLSWICHWTETGEFCNVFVAITLVIWSFYFVSKYKRVEISIISAIGDEIKCFCCLKRTYHTDTEDMSYL